MSKIKNPGELKSLYDIYANYWNSSHYLEAGQSVGEFDERQICLQINNKLVKEGERGFTGTRILKNWHINIFIHLQLIGQYFEGEFKPETENKEFLTEILSIWPDLIPAWYFGTVYIGYGEDLVEIEREYLRNNNKDYPEEKSKLWSKLRLYRKQQSKEGKNLYSSILSNMQGIAIDPERLVVCSCSGFINWVCWFDLLREYLAGQQKFISSFNACLKRVVSLVSNWPAFTKEIEQFEDNTIILAKSITQAQGINNNIYKPFEFMPLNAPEIILKTNQAYFELKASFLGVAGKALNNKSERMNLTETQQNLSLIQNMQARHLKSLELLALRMKAVFGPAIPEDFKITLTQDLNPFQQQPNQPNEGIPSSGFPNIKQDSETPKNSGQIKY